MCIFKEKLGISCNGGEGYKPNNEIILNISGLTRKIRLPLVSLDTYDHLMNSLRL